MFRAKKFLTNVQWIYAIQKWKRAKNAFLQKTLTNWRCGHYTGASILLHLIVNLFKNRPGSKFLDKIRPKVTIV